MKKEISINRWKASRSFPEMKSKLVEENVFKSRTYKQEPVPTFEQNKDKLPKPIWEGHKNEIEAYYRAWEICFAHIWQPDKDTEFITNYVDCNFAGCLFMWDGSFMLMFCKYANRIFNFQKTLDNFYAKQHGDGYICRQLIELTGEDVFEKHNPVSTGPNVMPWCEWEYYLNFNDKKRLEEVFL